MIHVILKLKRTTIHYEVQRRSYIHIWLYIMRDDNSTLPCCFCLIQLNSFLAAIVYSVWENTLPVAVCLLYQAVCLRLSLPASERFCFPLLPLSLSLSMWLPPAEQDSLPLLVSLIFHLLYSNLFSRAVAPSSAGRATKIQFWLPVSGGSYEGLLEEVPNPASEWKARNV